MVHKPPKAIPKPIIPSYNVANFNFINPQDRASIWFIGVSLTIDHKTEVYDISKLANMSVFELLLLLREHGDALLGARLVLENVYGVYSSVISYQDMYRIRHGSTVLALYSSRMLNDYVDSVLASSVYYGGIPKMPASLYASAASILAIIKNDTVNVVITGRNTLNVSSLYNDICDLEKLNFVKEKLIKYKPPKPSFCRRIIKTFFPWS